MGWLCLSPAARWQHCWQPATASPPATPRAPASSPVASVSREATRSRCIGCRCLPCPWAARTHLESRGHRRTAALRGWWRCCRVLPRAAARGRLCMPAAWPAGYPAGTPGTRHGYLPVRAWNTFGHSSSGPAPPHSASLGGSARDKRTLPDGFRFRIFIIVIWGHAARKA